MINEDARKIQRDSIIVDAHIDLLYDVVIMRSFPVNLFTIGALKKFIEVFTGFKLKQIFNVIFGYYSD